nr:reverse transcriptase domain-containing protein [Tanacetum cinerariifolium]
MERPEDDPQDTTMKDEKALSDPWILFTDRSSCIDGSEAGLIITNLEGMEFTYALRFRFDATNNEAEYEALIAGIIIYLEKVKALSNTFKEFSIKQVPRGKNKNADVLSKIASTSFANLSKQVLVEELKEKSIDEKEVLAVVKEEGHTWMTHIYEYLVEEILPKEKKKAKVIRRKAKRPFLKGPSKVKFLIVATDYFTKWIEAKPVATITGAQIKKFMWDNIVCRFGLPGEIISGNRKQFRDNM